MPHDAPVHKQVVEIKNGWGLHFRPARKFMDVAAKFPCDVTVTYNDASYNGKSLLDLTSMGAPQGAQLTIQAVGPDAFAAVEKLVALVNAGFYEDDNGQDLEYTP